MNRLYYGDNLDILREHIDDASVDLIYLDPPFNSNRSYNVLFREANGTSAASASATSPTKRTARGAGGRQGSERMCVRALTVVPLH